MSSAGITFSGLSSGIDTKSIIAALMAVERQPVDAMQQRVTNYQSQQTLFGTLGGLLDTLQQKAEALKTTTDFLAMKATVDKEQYLTATASNTAQPGSHTVQVLQLAQAEVNTTNGHADHDATQYGDSTLEIDIGGQSHFVSVGSGTGFASTLDGIAGAINAQGIGVTAQVVNTGATTNPYQLVLRSSTTGSAGAFSISVDSGPATMTSLIAETNAPANVLTQATDAQIKLDGLTLTRTSNTISDAIPGVTLDLHSITPTTPAPGESATVTVGTDASATSAKVKDLVDAYNAVVDFMTAQNQVDANGKAQGPLFGDSTLRTIQSTLRSIVGGLVNTGNQSYAMLVQAGIKSDKTGKLTFDQGKFQAALAADPTAVSNLFDLTGSGIANRLYDTLNSYSDPVNGLLKARNDGFAALIKDTQESIDAANQRLDQYQQSLETRFANMESLLSQLKSQGNSLGSLNTQPQ